MQPFHDSFVAPSSCRVTHQILEEAMQAYLLTQEEVRGVSGFNSFRKAYVCLERCELLERHGPLSSRSSGASIARACQLDSAMALGALATATALPEWN
jgi:hypothetical protein